MKLFEKSYFIKLLIIAGIFIFFPISIHNQVLSTIYTVIGIMFSIALSLIVSFNIQGIKSHDSIASIRYKLKVLQKKHISNFVMDTVLYLLSLKVKIVSFCIKGVEINLNIKLVILVILVTSIFYYIVNFTNIQKLRDQVFDELNGIH